MQGIIDYRERLLIVSYSAPCQYIINSNGPPNHQGKNIKDQLMASSQKIIQKLIPFYKDFGVSSPMYKDVSIKAQQIVTRSAMNATTSYQPNINVSTHEWHLTILFMQILQEHKLGVRFVARK